MSSENDMLCCGPKQVEPEIATDDTPVVREVLGPASDLPNGAKKLYEVREKKILVVNDNNKYYATSGLCSHYNFPLDKGFYHNGKIRCPLHGACFNMKTGDIEDYPGFDNLHAFEVRKIDDNLVLFGTEKKFESNRRRKEAKSVKLIKDNPIIVVGSGPAAANFIEHARINGVNTPITMVTEEDVLPYDRVLLSKNPSVAIDGCRLRDDDYYKQHGVEIMLNTKVTEVDTTRRQITTSNGGSVGYSKLVVATGGSVRKLTIPGHGLNNIFYLRTLQDAHAIAEAVKDKHVVCIGGSFIGLEIAASTYKLAASVTVLSSSLEPLPAFGNEIGAAVRKRFEAKGIKIICSAQAAEIQGTTEVTGVTLRDGTELPADVVIAGIGVLPNTDFLKSSNIKLDKRGFIPVDKHFRTNVDWVYAIGDVCAAPIDRWNLDSHNIQHFQTAQSHGEHLGYSIVGKPVPKPLVPFFWSVFFYEFGVAFSGVATGDEETFIRGDVDEMNFVKYYFKDNKVVAVAGAGPRFVPQQMITIFQKNKIITKDDVLQNETDDWQKFF
ncbi:unnamed protein product [Auanema sp. JU1783]|nr:unnamed protein product [Auanema sp. JU1783]